MVGTAIEFYDFFLYGLAASLVLVSADFIAIDQHLFDVPVERIHRTRVRQTWFAGRLVHEGSDAGF